jgi:hypothetical protein
LLLGLVPGAVFEPGQKARRGLDGPFVVDHGVGFEAEGSNEGGK